MFNTILIISLIPFNYYCSVVIFFEQPAPNIFLQEKHQKNIIIVHQCF